MKHNHRKSHPLAPPPRRSGQGEDSLLYQLIAEGEHQQQDFKYEISSVSKIAHTVSAFANTDGGRLLVGVRDNGSVAGVKSEEEIYMIDAAATTHCNPQVHCQWEILHGGGHNVLLATVPVCDQRPVMAREEDGSWVAYVRVRDENIVATPVHLALWRRQNRQDESFISLTEADRTVLGLLAQAGEEGMLLNRLCHQSRMARPRIINLLADFIRFGLVRMEYRAPKFYFIADEEGDI